MKRKVFFGFDTEYILYVDFISNKNMDEKNILKDERKNITSHKISLMSL